MSTIRVTGRGSIHVVPDVTRIEITVSGVFKAYDEAYKKAQEASSWMVKILEYNKLSGKMCKTVRMDISEHTVSDYCIAGINTENYQILTAFLKFNKQQKPIIISFYYIIDIIINQ